MSEGIYRTPLDFLTTCNVCRGIFFFEQIQKPTTSVCVKDKELCSTQLYVGICITPPAKGQEEGLERLLRATSVENSICQIWQDHCKHECIEPKTSTRSSQPNPTQIAPIWGAIGNECLLRKGESVFFMIQACFCEWSHTHAYTCSIKRIQWVFYKERTWEVDRKM